MKHYDIFISYRRSSYDVANLIATRLKAAGYSVFFDIEALRAGMFNVQLYEVIDNCNDFVLVLPPKALDRCVNEDDWVRLEVCRAMEMKKNIIPIMLNGFTWPDSMPAGMEELNMYHALTASTVEYFDMAMERLQKQYLHSRRRRPYLKVLKTLGVATLVVATLFAVLWGVFALLSQDVCEEYATALTQDASNVHTIVEQHASLVEEWNAYNEKIRVETKQARIELLKSKMNGRIDLAERNLCSSWLVDSAEMTIPTYHRFLLSLNGIKSEDVAMSPVLATLYYEDYKNLLESLRRAVNDHSPMHQLSMPVLFEIFDHSINFYYATMLSELSNFPKRARYSYDTLSSLWSHFPSYKIDEKDEYYEKIIQDEYGIQENLLAKYDGIVKAWSAELDDLQYKSDVLEQQISEGLNRIQNQTDSAALALLGATEIDEIKRQNAEELALTKERVKAREMEVNAQKAEMEELDKKYVAVYEELKLKCTIEEEDGQWYKWGKIRRWGTYLAMLVESRQELKSKGVYSSSSITPEVAYADMASLLFTYQSYHPESVGYVEPLKLFFRELSKGKRTNNGVVVYAFAEGATHPFFKVGDIIVAYDGQTIKNQETLGEVYRANRSGIVTFLRLVDGKFEIYDEPISNVEAVGFLDINE